MNRQIYPAIAGVATAVAITTFMDATGYSEFSALPLFPLLGLFWWLQKLTRREIGLTWGDARSHLWAVTYPLLVLGATIVIVFAAGAADTSAADWQKTWTNIGLMSSTGILGVLITEEGFFRGWLWASLKRAGQTDRQTLLWTTVAFVVWHISAVTLETGFDLPASEIPVYLINASLLGLIWGILRMISGSVLVAALCHAVWNGIDYPLFGFGEKVGALGIQDTHLYGPEVGLLGIVLNGLFFALIWRKYATPVPEKVA